MSDKPEGTGGTGAGDGSGGTAAQGHDGTGATGTEQNGESRAEARIRTLVDEIKDLKGKLGHYESAEEKRKREADLEAGKHQEVITDLQKQLEEYKPKAERWEKYHTSKRETLMDRLSDEDKTLADGMPLEKLELFVERVSKQPPGKGAGGNPGGSDPPRTGKATPEEVRANIHNPKWREENRGRIY